jgi:superoxide dismutase, Cu-Zn family
MTKTCLALAILLLAVPEASSSLRGHQEESQFARNLQSGASEYGCGRVMEAVLGDPSVSNTSGCGEYGVCGSVTFQCPENFNGFTEIVYSISGLTPGKHALHVHEFEIGTDGDDTCMSAGSHWNPMGNNHGSNLDSQRHIGDLGNILADDNGLAEGTLLAFVPLRGELGIRGKSVVVHEGTDDLGLGGDDGSRGVGNAGARPACGTIVIPEV